MTPTLTVDVARTVARLTLFGAPRTKKNSGTIWRVGTRTVIKPSDAWLAWRDTVRASLAQRPEFALGFSIPLNCAATFYRDREAGDAVGYYQGLADILEECGVVQDDKWIVSWDGSRLKKDRDCPRVELTLTWAALCAA